MTSQTSTTTAADIYDAVQAIRRARTHYGIDVRFRRTATGHKVAEFYYGGEFTFAVHGTQALIAGLA